jgi:hypothetical protein
MSIATKIAALLAALRPEGFVGLEPVERRRFADICRHWARIESGKIDGEENGVRRGLSVIGDINDYSRASLR